MISNQILQSNIDGLKEITRIDLCVCDVEGKVLASTFEQAEEYESSILAFADSPAAGIHPPCKGRQRRCLHGGKAGGVPDPESAGGL